MTTTAYAANPAQTNEVLTFNNLGDGATVTFNLKGATNYTACVVGTGFGTVTMNVLGCDGSTYVQVHQWSGNALTQLGALPPGGYELVIATASSVYVSLAAIPTRTNRQ